MRIKNTHLGHKNTHFSPVDKYTAPNAGRACSLICTKTLTFNTKTLTFDTKTSTFNTYTLTFPNTKTSTFDTKTLTFDTYTLTFIDFSLCYSTGYESLKLALLLTS